MAKQKALEVIDRQNIMFLDYFQDDIDVIVKNGLEQDWPFEEMLYKAIALINGRDVEKAGFDPGTRRRRADGTYEKQQDGSWIRIKEEPGAAAPDFEDTTTDEGAPSEEVEAQDQKEQENISYLESVDSTDLAEYMLDMSGGSLDDIDDPDEFVATFLESAGPDEIATLVEGFGDQETEDYASQLEEDRWRNERGEDDFEPTPDPEWEANVNAMSREEAESALAIVGANAGYADADLSNMTDERLKSELIILGQDRQDQLSGDEDESGYTSETATQGLRENFPDETEGLSDKQLLQAVDSIEDEFDVTPEELMSDVTSNEFQALIGEVSSMKPDTGDQAPQRTSAYEALTSDQFKELRTAIGSLPVDSQKEFIQALSQKIPESDRKGALDTWGFDTIEEYLDSKPDTPETQKWFTTLIANWMDGDDAVDFMEELQ